jgi:hypothetical protein
MIQPHSSVPTRLLGILMRLTSPILLHLTTSDRTARIPSMHYNSVDNCLKLIEVIQDNAFIVSVCVSSELVTCSMQRD